MFEFTVLEEERRELVTQLTKILHAVDDEVYSETYEAIVFLKERIEQIQKGKGL